MPRNERIIAVLRTACGCEQKRAYSGEPPEIRVAVQRPCMTFADPTYRGEPSHYIRTFEHGRVISTGEGALERIVEYNEVLPRQHTQDWRNAPTPSIEVMQHTAEGGWRRLVVCRVLRDIGRIYVETV